MPRRDDDSAEFEPTRTPKRKSNAVLWVVLGAAGFLVLVCGGGVAVMALGWLGARGVQPPAVAAPAAKTMTREEFRKLVMGKTEKEVKELAGLPDSTSDSGDQSWWHYRNRTTDPITGKVDRDAQVVFTNGKVESVNY